MKKHKLRISFVRILLFSIFCSLSSAPAIAQALSSSELISNAKQYDGKIVVYEGEIIGDIMQRGNFSWLNISDGSNTIGVWAESSIIPDIEYTGSYNTKGGRVEVVGVFHRACPQHGGDLDIHAQAIKRIASGRKVLDKVNLDKRNFAFILLGVLCLVLILRQLKIR